jgi:hypothetical protein
MSNAKETVMRSGLKFKNSVMGDNIKTGIIVNDTITGFDWTETSGDEGSLAKTNAFTNTGISPAIRITSVGSDEPGKVVLGIYTDVTKVTPHYVTMLTAGAGMGNSSNTDISIQFGQSLDYVLMSSADSVTWHYVIYDNANHTTKAGIILATWHHALSGSLNFDLVKSVNSVGGSIIDTEVILKVQEGLYGGNGTAELIAFVSGTNTYNFKLSRQAF